MVVIKNTSGLIRYLSTPRNRGDNHKKHVLITRPIKYATYTFEPRKSLKLELIAELRETHILNTIGRTNMCDSGKIIIKY